jgi:DNA replication protein DnaC
VQEKPDDMIPRKYPKEPEEYCPACGRSIMMCDLPYTGQFGIELQCECVVEAEKKAKMAQMERGTEILRECYRIQSGMFKRQQRHRFDNFDIQSTPERRKKAQAFNETKAFVEQYKNKTQPNVLYLYGAVGSGKTHLACSIANAVIDTLYCPARVVEYYGKYGNSDDTRTQKDVRVKSITDLLQNLRNSFDSDSGQANIMDECKNAKLLVIDDLGTEDNKKTWVIERLFELLNCRNGNELPTIITSNLMPSELTARLGPRIADRIKDESQLVHVPGGSERKAYGSVACPD